MNSIADAFSGDALQEMASQLLNGGGKRGGQFIYWRRPAVHTDGTPDAEPGWIFTASNDAFRLMESFAVGWTPLLKYGRVKGVADGVASKWFQILSHPDGPAEFPIEQILTYRWYDRQRCLRDTGVANVRFPQLAGTPVTEYDCPECNNRQYAKPVHLARHLTNDHNYDRANIIALGEQLGISFEKEKVKDRGVERVFVYDEEFAAEVNRAPAVSVADDAPQVQHITVQRATPAPPAGPTANERRAAGLAKARAAKAAKSLAAA